MGNFYGTYNRTLDNKNRLQLPSKLLKDLPSKLYILKGFEGCVSLFLPTDFDAFMKKLESLSYFKQAARAYLRLASSSVVELEIDSHGRITLPVQVKEKYGLNTEVTLIGVQDHIELWDSEKYLSYEKENSENFEALAESLESL